MKRLFCALALLILAGCTLPGPTPGQEQYGEAINTLPAAQDARYITGGAWYPNNNLGDLLSFHGSANPGRAFISETGLTFAIFEGGRYLKAIEIPFARADWFVIKSHGVSRIFTAQLDNQIQSFLLGDAIDGAGESVDIDQVADFVRARTK